jgi:hypothetical protein
MVTVFNCDEDGRILGFIQDRSVAGAVRRAKAGGATELARWLWWMTVPLPFGASVLISDGREWTIINTDRPRRA